jgi:hypothetical protein
MVCVVDGVTDCYFSIQMGSGLMSHKASRVISLLNACLSHDEDKDPGRSLFGTFHHTVYNMGKLSLDLLCPPDMRGALLRDRGYEHIAPAKILVFPASDISKYLTSINYPSDGRHYGPAMYIPFMRSLQGIAHEYALAFPKLSGSVWTGVGRKDSMMSEKFLKKVWRERMEACIEHQKKNGCGDC